jgi:ADP-dependent NAD(P)H-hydrate dehydratase / NAD(P)H-hydrate epimerase
VPCINSSGNAKLASAGTGDVLAGVAGSYLANNLSAFDAACAAVYLHGRVADQWPTPAPLTASAVAKRLCPVDLGSAL